MSKNFLTTRQVARRLGCSVRTVQQWFDKGRLSGWTTERGHRRIAPGSVEKICRGKRDNADTATGAFPVLIVEDEPTLLKLYRARLARWPFPTTVFTAPNGYEGLVMVGEVQPRMLICDLRLPGVNGFQIVRALREMPRYRTLSIVVITGLEAVEVDAHGGLPPGVELIGKPIDFDRLQAIAAVLKG